ncbi:MAG: hypothetical protein WD669_10695 [Pirellulales bacterium]
MFQRMSKRMGAAAIPETIVTFVVLLLAGCSGSPPQEEYDAAVTAMNTAQTQLDALRPAYDAAKQAAMLAVCKELAGATPEESLTGALAQLDSLTQANLDKQAQSDKKPGDIDATIDHLIAGQSAVSEHARGLFGSAGKVNEVMQKIKTPGTPEAQRFEEVFAAKPEVQAYQRQEQRLARAKQAMLEAEAKLPNSPE